MMLDLHNRTCLPSWKLLQSGERKPHGLLWLPQGWSWQVCHLAPSGAESPVNTPWPCFRQAFKCMLGAWEDELCEHAFQGGKSTLPFLCSSAQLWLKSGWCNVSCFLRVVHLAVGPGLPCVLYSAFYRIGKIQGEEGGTDTAPFGCLPVQYFRTTLTCLRKKCLHVKGLAIRTKLFIRILKEECTKM